MKPSEQLSAAKALITLPEHWTQNAYMRDKEGCLVLSYDRAEACSFCGIGALTVAGGYGDSWHAECSNTAQYLNEAAGCYFPSYNDHSSHRQVLDVFSKAISLAEADEAKEAV